MVHQNKVSFWTNSCGLLKSSDSVAGSEPSPCVTCSRQEHCMLDGDNLIGRMNSIRSVGPAPRCRDCTFSRQCSADLCCAGPSVPALPTVPPTPRLCLVHLVRRPPPSGVRPLLPLLLLRGNRDVLALLPLLLRTSRLSHRWKYDQPRHNNNPGSHLHPGRVGW